MQPPKRRLSTAKAMRKSFRSYHLTIAIIALVMMMGGTFGAGLFMAAHYGDKLPLVKEVEQARMIKRELEGRSLTNPLDAMAIRLAELQAQVARLDAISYRLLKSVDLSETADVEMPDGNPPGQGGLFQKDQESLSFKEIKTEVKSLAQRVERQADILSVIDSDQQSAKARYILAPTETPLREAVSVSRFGTRIDPFTGRRARHDGIDFMAPRGSPILAAAAGVVVKAGYDHGYGYMVDIEHANNVMTRYAHASKLLVKSGDVVKSGQKIATVGSSGRSTGPHLHFEVRVNGVPKNPKKFLAQNTMPRPGPATIAALDALLGDNFLNAKSE